MNNILPVYPMSKPSNTIFYIKMVFTPSFKEILLENFFPQDASRSRVKLEAVGSLFNNNGFWNKKNIRNKEQIMPVYSKKNIIVVIKKYGGVFVVRKFKNAKEKNIYLKTCTKNMKML